MHISLLVYCLLHCSNTPITVRCQHSRKNAKTPNHVTVLLYRPAPHTLIATGSTLSPLSPPPQLQVTTQQLQDSIVKIRVTRVEIYGIHVFSCVGSWPNGTRALSNMLEKCLSCMGRAPAPESRHVIRIPYKNVV